MTLKVDWIPAGTPPTEACGVLLKVRDHNADDDEERIVTVKGRYDPDAIFSVWADLDDNDLDETSGLEVIAWAPFERPEVGP